VRVLAQVLLLREQQALHSELRLARLQAVLRVMYRIAGL
jgi:hypothetical protein